MRREPITQRSAEASPSQVTAPRSGTRLSNTPPPVTQEMLPQVPSLVPGAREARIKAHAQARSWSSSRDEANEGTFERFSDLVGTIYHQLAIQRDPSVAWITLSIDERRLTLNELVVQVHGIVHHKPDMKQVPTAIQDRGWFDRIVDRVKGVSPPTAMPETPSPEAVKGYIIEALNLVNGMERKKFERIKMAVARGKI